MLTQKDKEGSQKAREVTIDHKPNLPMERKRIYAKGGEVSKEDYDDETPWRVFIQGHRFPGLAMSRACGDLVANSVGVICEPEVIHYQINPAWNYLVLCSDGVWEFVETKTASDIIQNSSNDLNQACTELSELSYKKWIKSENE